MKRALAVAAVVMLAAALFYLTLRGVVPGVLQPAGVASKLLTEAFFRRALADASELQIEWDEFAVSLAPLSVTLDGVTIQGADLVAVVARSNQVILRLAAHEGGGLPGGLPLEIVSARLLGLELELPGARSVGRALALRELHVEWSAPSAAGSLDDTSLGSAEVSGHGEFEQGGTLRFRAHPVVVATREKGFEVDAHFSAVPAGEWAAWVPDLRDASGTIAGRLELAVRPGFGLGLDGSNRSTSAAIQSAAIQEGGDDAGGDDGSAPVEGRFEIDATGAALSLAGAYRKAVGDPATLSGRFESNPPSEFQLLEVHLSIRKAKGESK